MNIDELRKHKELERAKIARKIAAGQSFEQHAEEVSGFDLDLIRSARFIVKGPDGEDHVLGKQS